MNGHITCLESDGVDCDGYPTFFLGESLLSGGRLSSSTWYDGPTRRS